MREAIRDKGRIEHILLAIDNILRFLSDTSREQFRKEEVVYYAVVKNIEIVGEASNMLTKELREAHPEVEWSAIIGMRHVLVHDYYQLSEQEIWDTATKNIPPLKPLFQAIHDAL